MIPKTERDADAAILAAATPEKEAMSPEYQEAMRRLGDSLDPKDGWRPLTVDGEIIAWIQVPLGQAERGFKEALAHLACGFGNKRGKC